MINKQETYANYEKFNKSKFNSYLFKGQLHEAVNYLSVFPDKADYFEKYINIFQRGHYYKRTDNEVVGNIDKIYQNYYRNIFWDSISIEDADGLLIRELWSFCGSKMGLPMDKKIETRICKMVESEGYNYLGGITQGFYGPYIWEKSSKVIYEVELPSGIEMYPIIMMYDFISRSWLDFISFGQMGTGGWIGEDGTLYCVRDSYDIKSIEFTISFLKHEAQHAYDKRIYPNISSIDLEYRAKLVELIYWPNDELIKSILTEADKSNPNNSHAVAAFRIIEKLSDKIFRNQFINNVYAWNDRVDDVKKYALELYNESSRYIN